jgi:hypothetical protein
VISLVFLAGTGAFAGPTLQNGDFSSGLDFWTVESGTVTDGGGYALFEEHPVDLSSTLSQVFTIPALANRLSFDVLMSYGLGGDYDPFAWPDAFTASLLDPVTLDPLLSNPGYTDFFYLDNTGVVETIATVWGNTVKLDVSGLAGLDAYMVFNLLGSADGMMTSVTLDNVNISVIPAPGALLLGLIGASIIGSWRRFLKRD